MLKRLRVQNFAIIEDVTIDFKEGMTVLTGQTGAGKSLIIDSISLLLGDRSDTDMIRYGCQKATIEGEFTYNNHNIDTFLENNNLPILNTLLLTREISKSKSVAKINGNTVPLLLLKNLAPLIGDIHVQHDTYRLFNKDTYLSFIDPKNDPKFDKIYNDYQITLQGYLNSYKEYEKILLSSKESANKLDYLEFTYKEINSLNLTKDEDIKLEEMISKLSNFDKINNALREGINNLSNEYFSLDNIYIAYDAMKRIKDYDPLYDETARTIEESYYNLLDCLSNMKSYLSGLDFDEIELDEMNSRLNSIENLKHKYKKSLNELIEYQEEIKLELELINNYDEVLLEYERKLSNKYDILVKAATSLSEFRKKRSSFISQELVSLCKELELPHSRFEIKFDDVEYTDFKNKSIFNENGVDSCEFLISTNLGEPLKPLSKTASGGELSRIMLAFKTFFSKESKISLLVFDEIDSGVSGFVASEIAKKMKEISKNTQVLAITHLPQVAANADNQVYIYKEEKDGRTYTYIEELSFEDRIVHIAKMLSGEKVSRYALDAAKDLLEK